MKVTVLADKVKATAAPPFRGQTRMRSQQPQTPLLSASRPGDMKVTVLADKIR